MKLHLMAFISTIAILMSFIGCTNESIDATYQESSIDIHTSSINDPDEAVIVCYTGEQESIKYLEPHELYTALISDEREVGAWVYFLYPNTEWEVYEDTYSIFRCRDDRTQLTRISSARCDSYDVVGDSVYFADYSMSGYEHGVLYVIDSGKEPVELANELCFYQIADNYIYYAHSFDTIGVGIEGHALHRMDLDGSNHMIAAYETSGPGIKSGHIGEVRNGYVYYENIQIKLGEPADGTEEVQVLAPLDTDDDDGWFYYATNRLMKIRPDGSEQMILDGNADTWIYIHKVDNDWIYYQQQAQGSEASGFFKIRKNGTGKTEIDQVE